MTQYNSKLTLGYDYEAFIYYGEKIEISACCESTNNTHMILTGMSGSGKSKAMLTIFARLVQLERDALFFFADFKQDDSFSFLRKAKRYYPFETSINAVEVVYEILLSRQSGKDDSRKPVTLLFDEYVACILYLQDIDKKQAESVMKKISTILMIGRSLCVRVIISCQRPDANVFKNGARLNFGVVIILEPTFSIIDMLVPKEYIKGIEEKKFSVGEGVVLLQQTDMHYIKMPIIQNHSRVRELCVLGLSN